MLASIGSPLTLLPVIVSEPPRRGVAIWAFDQEGRFAAFDVSFPFTVLPVPISSGTVVAELTYQVRLDARPGLAPLENVDRNFGFPPIPNVFYTEGLSLHPVLSSGAITVVGVVELDVVFASNGASVAMFDDFDDGVLDPLWDDFGTSPGPESGTVLTMFPNDVIFRPFTTTAPEGTAVVASINPVDFSSESAVFVLLTAGPASDPLADILAVVVVSGSVLLADEVDVIGIAPLPPDPPNVTLVLVIAADGTLFVLANGAVVFVGPNTLGAPNGIAVAAQ